MFFFTCFFEVFQIALAIPEILLNQPLWLPGSIKISLERKQKIPHENHGIIMESTLTTNAISEMILSETLLRISGSGTAPFLSQF